MSLDTGHLPILSNRTGSRVLRSTLHHHEQTYRRNIVSTMSSSAAGQKPSTPSSNFNSILDDALSEYKKETGSGLLEHPLAEQVKRCDSIGDISAILQGQAREFQQFRDGDQRLMKWISPMVDVLSTFSETLGGVASIVRPRYPVRNH
jgi:hypothetical protein